MKMIGYFKNVCYGLVASLKLLDIHVDKYTLVGGRTLLECRFNLEGEGLYSVKWYKDGNEFYRYVPLDNPKMQAFPIRGIHVKLEESNQTQVVLEPLELSSSGKYTCEVSAEAPSFQTAIDYGIMTTMQLPAQGPRIDGGRPRYQVGDMVRLNCTSGPSKPAAKLNWYINGVQVQREMPFRISADDSLLLGPRIQSVGPYLEEAALGLEFRVKRHHFKHGDLKLKCLASIGTMYWKSNEESVEGDRPQRPPVLEVRDNQPHSSRTDLVQMPSGEPKIYRTRSSIVFNLILLLLTFIR